MTGLFSAPRHRRRSLIVAESILLLIGFVLLGWAGYTTGQRVLYSSWEGYRFEQSLQGEDVTLLGYLNYLAEGARPRPHAEGEQPVAETPRPVPRTRKLQRNELIGRIEIPRVKVSAVVKEGADEKTLSRAVGHVPYTALPGEKSNVGVAAHRDTFFRGLRHVREGDTIRMVTSGGVFTYEVDELKIVWPRNVEVLDPTPEERITLVTCYPFNYVGNAPKRFIVQGKLKSFEQTAAKSSPNRTTLKPGT